MKEGAWIRVKDGAWWWIDEHASWIQRRENARRVGLPEHVSQTISAIQNDFVGENRRRILLAVMSQGFIRLRGHGAYVSLEFTCPTADALRACRAVLKEMAGQFLQCRFNNLVTGETIEFYYRDYAQLVGNETE